MSAPNNILAIDTSTNRIAVGLVQFAKDEKMIVKDDALRHAEYASELIREIVESSKLNFLEIGAIVCGIGPGPFTGLRVGIVSAQTIGFALNIPVYGVCSHDAIAYEFNLNNPNKEVTVITDARRKEVYWTHYSNGKRISTPKVSKLDEVVIKGEKLLHQPLNPLFLAKAGIDALNRSEIGREINSFSTDSASGDGSVVSLPNQVLLPPIPLYLRKPDALTLAERS